LQYNGSGEGYDERTPFSMLQPSQERSSRMPSLTTIVSVDELSAQYELDSSQRKAAHAFRKVRITLPDIILVLIAFFCSWAARIVS
jgi:hypothetical protein